MKYHDITVEWAERGIKLDHERRIDNGGFFCAAAIILFIGYMCWFGQQTDRAVERFAKTQRPNAVVLEVVR